MIKNQYILATHVWTDGPAQALREYLIKKKSDFIWIQHPLNATAKIESGYILFDNGKEIKHHYYKSIFSLLILKYFREIILNIYFVNKVINNDSYIFIGYDCLNAFSGIVLKKLHKVKKVIYYVIDYTPRRFENRFLNYIYHKIDRFCIKNVDETWSLNEKAMNNARYKYYHFDTYEKGNSIQKEVPMGYWGDRIKLNNFKQINQNQLVFLGHIIEKQGLQFVIKALPTVIKKSPDLKFIIIGTGEYLNHLKKLVTVLKLQNTVIFKGYLKDLNEVEKILCQSALAIAIYEEGDPEKNFTYYTDQGKIKLYLGCGLPILLSKVAPIANDIEKNKCGFIISNNSQDISAKILEILSHEKTLFNYRKNVLKYRTQFDWNLIFKNVL